MNTPPMRLGKIKDIPLTTYTEHCTGGLEKCTKERKKESIHFRKKLKF